MKNKISRNAPCPCGSGKKYKRCCGAEEQSHSKGFTAGIRMKGGVRFDEQADGYVPIVHTWDNVHCHGEPTEWRSPKIFPTEEEAMKYYKLFILPNLQRMMSEIEKELSDGTFVHHKLE
ncbi:MAG: SEC-C metal-binding domain-containing protein [bacterium]